MKRKLESVTAKDEIKTAKVAKIPDWLENDISSVGNGGKVSPNLRKFMLATGLWLKKDVIFYNKYVDCPLECLTPNQCKYIQALDLSIAYGYRNLKHRKDPTPPVREFIKGCSAKQMREFLNS